jgi:hypothetical protein
MTDRRAPPIAIELSGPILAACRRDPALTSAINAILLRAARRLRSLMTDGSRVRLKGRAEGLTLDLLLLPPDSCRVERIVLSPEDGAPDLTV